MAAHFSEVSVVFVVKASAMCLAPAGLSLFLSRLQTRVKSGQRVERWRLQKVSMAADSKKASTWQRGAHLIYVKVVLTLSMSAILVMPSAV